MNRKKLFFFPLISLLIFLTGCFGGPAEEGSKLLGGTNLNGSSSEATAVFKSNVKRVSQVKLDGDYIILPSNGKYAPGDIITFSYASGTVAKKIISIADGKALVTDPELDEIFEKLEIEDSIDLVAENLEANSLPAGVMVQNNKINAAGGALSSDDSGLKYYITDYELIDYSKFSKPVADAMRAANTSIKVSGSILLKKPKVDFSYNLITKSVKLVVNTGDVAELTINGNANYEKMIIDKEIFLGNYVIPISAAGIPLGNVTFALTMNTGVSGKINFNVRAYQQLDVAVGVEGKYGKDSGINFIYPTKQDIEKNLKYGYEAKANGNIDAWCSLRPRASLVVFQYEMAAVRGDLGVEGHVVGEASSSANESQPFTANANLSVSAKVYAIVDVDFKPISSEPAKTKNILNWSKEFTGNWSATATATPKPVTQPASDPIFDNRVFDINYYGQINQDVYNAFGGNQDSIKKHWENYGLSEGRIAHPNFSVKAYLERYPDLKSAFGTNYKAALIHYIQSGISEGRSGTP